MLQGLYIALYAMAEDLKRHLYHEVAWHRRGWGKILCLSSPVTIGQHLIFKFLEWVMQKSANLVPSLGTFSCSRSSFHQYYCHHYLYHPHTIIITISSTTTTVITITSTSLPPCNAPTTNTLHPSTTTLTNPAFQFPPAHSSSPFLRKRAH